MPDPGRQVLLGVVVVVGLAVGVGVAAAAVVDVVKPDLGLVAGAWARVELAPSSADVVLVVRPEGKAEYFMDVIDADAGPPRKVDDARVGVELVSAESSLEGACEKSKVRRAVPITEYAVNTLFGDEDVTVVLPSEE